MKLSDAKYTEIIHDMTIENLKQIIKQNTITFIMHSKSQGTDWTFKSDKTICVKYKELM